MSKNKLLALAVAAAFAAPAAFATTVTVGAGGTDWTVLPLNEFDTATDTAPSLKNVTILANASSVYLGRTTGYNVRLTLSQGVFDGNPSAAVAGATDSVSLAGGGNGLNVATFAVVPNQVDGVVAGDGIQFGANDIEVRNVAALGSGGVVSVLVQVFDPVGGNQLGPDINANLIQTVQGWQLSFAGPDGGTLGANQRIDVGTNATFGSKTVFSPDGVVNSTAQTALFSAGKINVGLASGLTDPLSLDPAVATSQIIVSGSDFGSLDDAFLSLDANCGAITASATTITATTITFPAVAVGTLNGHYICFETDTTTTIQNQDISATAGVSQPGTISLAAQSDNGNLLDLAYNGIVKIVSSFNPASNPSVDSLLRVINTSAVPGLFTVEGTCQNGTSLTAATFTLSAGHAVQYSSAELESGNAGAGKPALSNGLGACPAGRSRLVITGEVGTAEVQNFLRSSTSAGVITAGHNNQD